VKKSKFYALARFSADAIRMASEAMDASWQKIASLTVTRRMVCGPMTKKRTSSQNTERPREVTTSIESPLMSAG
jgi:hypothetical protein